MNHPLFPDEVVRLIYQFSKGIPRRINNLCTAYLVADFADEKPVIDEVTVKEFQDDAVA